MLLARDSSLLSFWWRKLVQNMEISDVLEKPSQADRFCN